MIPEDLMREYKYGYVHSCEMLNEPFVKDLIKENQELNKENDRLAAKLNKNKILQNEFRKWLENEIELLPTLTTFFYNREGHSMSETEVMLKEVKKVYKKYKEITGVKDERIRICCIDTSLQKG